MLRRCRIAADYLTPQQRAAVPAHVHNPSFFTGPWASRGLAAEPPAAAGHTAAPVTSVETSSLSEVQRSGIMPGQAASSLPVSPPVQQVPAWATPTQPATGLEERAAAMRAFQQQQAQPRRAQEKPTVELTAAETAAWDLFTNTDDPMTEAEVSDAAAYLDKHRLMGAASPAPTAAAAASAPREEGTAEQRAARRYAASDPERDAKFAAALAAIRRCFHRSGVPFFLTCGTALGVVREARFLPHDTDIDLGVFYADAAAAAVARLGQDASAQARADAARNAVSEAVLRLLSEFTATPDLVCFDVLGELDAGFQLRVQHSPSGALIDVNLYYESAEGEAAPLLDPSVPPEGRYVWSATHYADSASRKHGMYRYRNASPLLMEGQAHSGLSTAAGHAASAVEFHGERYAVAGRAYLREYYGADWGTPKVYGYDEGLAGEFRNIIAE